MWKGSRGIKAAFLPKAEHSASHTGGARSTCTEPITFHLLQLRPLWKEDDILNVAFEIEGKQRWYETV